SAPSFPVGRGPVWTAVGDVNSDGLPDLATANLYGGNTVSVLLGNGDGSFRPARNFDASGTNSIAVGAFNGDGIPDLVTTGSVLLGNGDGSFQAARYFDAGRNPLSVAVGEFNGDGLQDLAVTYQNRVGVLLG